jgi:tetratricopeptide (TPR) repeat protein
MMNTATIRRFLILLSSERQTERLGLYQLVESAERFYRLQDFTQQKEIGVFLQQFPSPFYEIGAYHEAIYLHRQGEFEKAWTLLEYVAEKAPDRYRAKALLSLGAVEQSRNNFTDSLKYRMEACKLADPVTLLQAQSGIAVIQSIGRNHKGALRHFEELAPLARSVGSGPEYWHYLNSLAVELSEVGRLEEAANISKIIIASPYASFYPEWHDTQGDIAFKLYRGARSMAYFTKIMPHNVVRIKPSGLPSQRGAAPARILNLQDWKKKMPKRANGDEKDQKDQDYKLPSNPTDRDIFLRIMHLASKEGISEKKLWKILEAVEKITEEPDED